MSIVCVWLFLEDSGDVVARSCLLDMSCAALIASPHALLIAAGDCGTLYCIAQREPA